MSEKEVMKQAIEHKLNPKELSLALEIKKFLETIKDEGTGIDTGAGLGSADLWVKIGGIEYYINIKKSGAA